MLITHWKTEGHKKNVLKKDKSQLMINLLIFSFLNVILTAFATLWKYHYKLLTFNFYMLKLAYFIPINGPIFRFKIAIL